MKQFATVFVVAIGIGLIGVGCARKAANDDVLANDIKAQLYSDPTTKAANISVAVKGGMATLAGDVPSADVELQAMKLANATAGVARVNDQMKVNPATSMNQAGTNQPTPEISAQNQPPGAPVRATQAQPTPLTNPQPAPQAPAMTPTPAPIPAHVPEHVAVRVPAGEHISVQMIDAINSAHNTTGQMFRATLYGPVVSQGRTIFPAGTPVSVLLASAKNAGRIRGNSELELRLAQINYHGRTYPVTSSAYEEEGKGRGKSTAVRTGVGAAAGAIIGALAGGGKGAAIGTVVGGGGTAGYQLATHGQQVKVPSEAILNFRLESPLVVEKRVE